MSLALEENEKLMDRYRQVEKELQTSLQGNKQLKVRHIDEMVNAENRIKLTQEQAMSQLRQMKET